VRVISTRRGWGAPHLQPRRESDAETLRGLLQALHATGWSARWSGVRRMVASRRKST